MLQKRSLNADPGNNNNNNNKDFINASGVSRRREYPSTNWGHLKINN